MQGQWAKFWAMDLHVHTPASSDASTDDFGTPEDIVEAALAANLDAIAITDHNTAKWCERMAEAAKYSELIILPGVELSTPDGHLLGIWEEGTGSSIIDEVLVRVGISGARSGELDVITSLAMSECAEEISNTGGLAIAAHIDKPRGILEHQSQTYVNTLLKHPNIAAYEYVKEETPSLVEAKLSRLPALTQSSDAYDGSLSRHSITGIGRRRTWVKAARPDLCGLRHALNDPELRTTLGDPAETESSPSIDSLSISAGFLEGTNIDFSPDLNCLLGGTGTGKSLTLEAIRFVLDQQIEPSLFGTIRGEVDRRLEMALREGTEVSAQISSGEERYKVKRTFSSAVTSPIVHRQVGDEWVQIDENIAEILRIAAYSQGEILEYARQPVGRVDLVDEHIDLTSVNELIQQIKRELNTNATELIAARETVETLEETATQESELKERAAELSKLFDETLVEQQAIWSSEKQALKTLSESLETVKFQPPKIPEVPKTKMSPDHDGAFARMREARKSYSDAIETAREIVERTLGAFQEVVGEVQGEFHSEFSTFSHELDKRLEESGEESLPKLGQELRLIQQKLSLAENARDTLTNEASPALEQLTGEREKLLSDLNNARVQRRKQRRVRVKTLNKNISGSVKIDIPDTPDRAEYREELQQLKVGSRVRDLAVERIADNIHPFKLARALWSGDVSLLGDLPEGVKATDINRLHTNIANNEQWHRIFTLQAVEMSDILNVKFRKPEGQEYVAIDDLSHGQKCTAILVILLSDGATPVLIDQPEDALHAPWIEDYLVERLRERRGARQYIFATRSPGLVVSADSEQLITMRAHATKGEVEARGSLERVDLNKLALHHLEGGKTPFDRRAQKLQASLS